MNYFIIIRLGRGVPQKIEQKAILHLTQTTGRSRLLTGNQNHFGVLIETQFSFSYVFSLYQLLTLNTPNEQFYVHRVSSLELANELTFQGNMPIGTRALRNCVRYHRCSGLVERRRSLKKTLTLQCFPWQQAIRVDRVLEKIAVCGRQSVTREELNWLRVNLNGTVFMN